MEVRRDAGGIEPEGQAPVGGGAHGAVNLLRVEVRQIDLVQEAVVPDGDLEIRIPRVDFAAVEDVLGEVVREGLAGAPDTRREIIEGVAKQDDLRRRVLRVFPRAGLAKVNLADSLEVDVNACVICHGLGFNTRTRPRMMEVSGD